MTIIATIITIIWIARITANTISYIHLWFVKEHRLDRMFVHLHTDQGKRIFFPVFKVPPLTPKTIFLFISTLSILLTIFFHLSWNIFSKLLFLDIMTFPITMLLEASLSVPTILFHKIKIIYAKKILARHTFLYKIGITGSYGKTSIKEYLATILSTKYHVLKTERSINSPIGIAERIIRGLNHTQQILIAEMAAYKCGEIREMARMIYPDIGIITAVNEQHQDLFGTIETTVKAKYELIEGLSANGIAIFNADNKYTLIMARRAKKEGKTVWLYSSGNQKLSFADKALQANNIKIDDLRVSFRVVSGKEQEEVNARVLGEHQVNNILAGIAGALACKMSLHDAAKTASNIEPFEKTMQPVEGLNGSLFINDTFNNNPDAAIAALKYIELKKTGKKFIVFQPMIELGRYSESAHRRVGEEAAKICDYIILTNRNFLPYFTKGVKKISSIKKIDIFSPLRAASFIKDKIRKGDIVLFKGKEAETVLKILKKQT